MPTAQNRNFWKGLEPFVPEATADAVEVSWRGGGMGGGGVSCASYCHDSMLKSLTSKFVLDLSLCGRQVRPATLEVLRCYNVYAVFLSALNQMFSVAL